MVSRGYFDRLSMKSSRRSSSRSLAITWGTRPDQFLRFISLLTVRLSTFTELKQKIRDDWTDEQAVDDIERQLQGVGFAKPSVDRAIRPQGPAQKLLVGALTTPLDDTLQGQYRRRDNTIGAIVAYCGVEEGLTVRRTHALPTTSAPHENPREHSEDSPLFLATLSVFIDNPKQRPRRCFLCIGSAHSLPPEDPRIEDKISEFYTPGDLSKHFRRRHLSKLQDNDQPVCQVCDMTLAHKMHLQKHSISVHGTIS